MSQRLLQLSKGGKKSEKWQLRAPSQSGGIHLRWSRGFMVCDSSPSCFSHLHFLPGLGLCDPCLRVIFPPDPADPADHHQILLFLPANYLTFVSLPVLLVVIMLPLLHFTREICKLSRTSKVGEHLPLFLSERFCEDSRILNGAGKEL